MKNRIAIFASGNGSNFQKIVEDSSKYNYKVTLLFCDRKNAQVIQRAKSLNIPYIYLSIIKEKDQYDFKILSFLEKYKINLIVLAGYMKLINKSILHQWEGRIINIHPSLLPKYPGFQAIERAIKNKDNKFGITIHYVDENVDTGKIIFQESFKCDYRNSPLIYNKIHKLEHKYYSKIINDIVNK